MVKQRNPVNAMNDQSAAFRGTGNRRTATMHVSTNAAMMNRMPAKLTGGRSRRPILMKSQVEPQIALRMSQTRSGVDNLINSGQQLTHNGTSRYYPVRARLDKLRGVADDFRSSS